MRLELGKRYITSNERILEIIHIDRSFWYPYTGRDIESGNVFVFSPDGKSNFVGNYSTAGSPGDLLKEVPKIDVKFNVLYEDVYKNVFFIRESSDPDEKKSIAYINMVKINSDLGMFAGSPIKRTAYINQERLNIVRELTKEEVLSLFNNQ
jgi:hypothetical protein